MYDLFNIIPSTHGGINEIGVYGFLPNQLNSNLVKALEYYNRSPIPVKSSHFLVNLLHAINVPKSLDIYRYYDNVDAIALDVAMAHGITSSKYKGHVFKGLFYSPDISDIVIANNDYFDIEDAETNWKKLTPITVIRNPITNLSMKIPDGNWITSETGVSIVLINITMLAIQYRMFRKEEEYNSIMNDGESQKTIMHFIHMYPLANMLPSHINCVLFNRIYNINFDIPIDDIRRQVPFWTIDVTKYLNIKGRALVKYLKANPTDFYNTLRQIPLLGVKNMAEWYPLPNLTPTRQVIWAMDLSRLNVLKFLCDISGASLAAKNTTAINRVKRRLLNYKSNSLLESVLPIDLYIDTKYEINSIEEKI